ncbi:MAG: Lrp/AsnC family transcriptional regulator [Chloroflexota bacterium]
MMNLNDTAGKLVGGLQADFPLTEQPYADLGKNLNISEAEVITIIRQLQDEGILRQMGAVFDARHLGYRTTLVAMKVAPARMERAAAVIREHPGISHGYERKHDLNLWCTLAARSQAALKAEVERLGEDTGAEVCFSLPARRLFKLRTYFAPGNDAPTGTGTSAPEKTTGETPLSGEDRAVINALQRGLPLASRPFAPLSAAAGMDEAAFLARCRTLLRRGIIRRFSAAVNHRRAGFNANAMTCWVAPPEKIDAAARQLTALRQVSHCYERQTNPHWRYNLFAMIHGADRESCREIADKVSAETGLEERVVLFSSREIKKTRVPYPV